MFALVPLWRLSYGLRDVQHRTFHCGCECLLLARAWLALFCNWLKFVVVLAKVPEPVVYLVRPLLGICNILEEALDHTSVQ